jgi:5'-nucleotidase
MLILITNDDGVDSGGLHALARALAPLGEVYTVAPDRERTAAGHALTLSHPLRARALGRRRFSVDGTPTDCVTLGATRLLPRKPDLVVSGINRGSNLGDDVTYSGTVSAAFEATLLGIPAFAVSVDGQARFRFRLAAEFARALARRILEEGLPRDTLLNVNVPDLPASRVRGVAITRQGRREYREMIVEKTDPRGRTYYWIGGSDPAWARVPDSDAEAVRAGRISITPLHLDLTNHRARAALRRWAERPWPWW